MTHLLLILKVMKDNKCSVSEATQVVQKASKKLKPKDKLVIPTEKRKFSSRMYD